MAVSRSDSVPTTLVRLPGATAPRRSSTGTVKVQRASMMQRVVRVNSAVGGAIGGASLVSGNDLAGVLRQLAAALQRLADVVGRMAGTRAATAPPAGAGSAPAAGGSVPAIATRLAKASPTPSGSSTFEQRVMELINGERARYGMGALTFNGSLDRAANSHNAHQVQVRAMAHVNIGDGDPGSRIRATGFGGAWGENVAVGQRSPEQVVREWMNSPTHRANILNPSFRQYGIAYGVTADGYPFWTQTFGS